MGPFYLRSCHTAADFNLNCRNLYTSKEHLYGFHSETVDDQ